MKIKLEALQGAKPALETLLGADMTITNAYRFSKLIKAVNAELKNYDEMRIKILQDLDCPLSDDGTHYDLPADKQAEFMQKMQELLGMEVDINFPGKIDISGEVINISPKMAIDLDPFITLGDE